MVPAAYAGQTGYQICHRVLILLSGPVTLPTAFHGAPAMDLNLKPRPRLNVATPPMVSARPPARLKQYEVQPKTGAKQNPKLAKKLKEGKLSREISQAK
ncbi:hypothetical protein N7488_005079 [Penicillium malachiteum]|nr:hypothetical protein N7488_005079 [Penicillium malachiteum]